MPDHEMWLAMHDECPWPGCGRCVVESIEVDEDALRLLRAWSLHTRRPLDVLIYEAIEDHLKERGFAA